MKVGDMVQVLPARWGYYIIVEEATDQNYDGDRMWMLKGCPGSNFSGGGIMSEKYIEVVSEGR
mgnify:CR=1 FL=1